ncbi:c-type cytochrome [Thiomicrorhabdus heinhorstiae]|uniref:Cytochrome c domain-containing protein n=1 Tax=Thiomicrorhabdus heinhorstiae TaxID=2748010 RepID=A0ABS0C0S7_9GAMM|nr:hypothetical protein [Thiomicrorhabdus heinhorstiae]MBF6058943.1 hypothetical protein [Thiomicrorhabdus heinhorstiae]
MHKNNHRKWYRPAGMAMISLAGSLLLTGCFDSSSQDNEINSGIYFDISTVDYSAVTVDASAADLAPGARLLASQCAECHGTYGVAVRDWPDLWGSGRQISNWMKLYQDLNYEDNMMHVHALGYTEDEVNLLKTYYPKIEYSGAQ